MDRKTIDIKCTLLGAKNVGKTCIFNRILHDQFSRTSMTIGAYFAQKVLDCGQNLFLHMALWDTAGEERYDSLTNFYCRGSNIAIICYDITSEDSWRSLPHWHSKLNKETNCNDKCRTIIVGCKLDLISNTTPRAVAFEDVLNYGKSINALGSLETSAKDGTNISEILNLITKYYTSLNLSNSLVQYPGNKIDLKEENKNKKNEKKSCC